MKIPFCCSKIPYIMNGTVLSGNKAKFVRTRWLSGRVFDLIGGSLVRDSSEVIHCP